MTVRDAILNTLIGQPWDDTVTVWLRVRRHVPHIDVLDVIRELDRLAAQGAIERRDNGRTHQWRLPTPAGQLALEVTP